MTAPSYRQAQWLISGRDFTVHAFHHPAPPGRDFLEALCDHTVTTIRSETDWRGPA